MKQGVIDALAKDNRLLNGTLPLAFFEPDQRRLSFRGASKARGRWDWDGRGSMCVCVGSIGLVRCDACSYGIEIENTSHHPIDRRHS